MPLRQKKSKNFAGSRVVRQRHFLAAWMRSPLTIGSLVPSSRALARAMAAVVDPNGEGTVIELGPGTGVITHALLDRIKPSRLLVIEREQSFYYCMCMLFPELNILQADAMALGEVLAEQKVTKVDAIVSSLPLLSMPKPVRQAIEKQMSEAIGEHGVIVQYTYGHKSPISRDELKRYRLSGQRVKFVLNNMPPAHVWVYRRTPH